MDQSVGSGIDPTTSALIAVGAALFAFCLATARDLWRERRERRRRQRAALRNFCREMSNNRRACSSNLMMLAVEKNDLEERRNKGHMTPLDRLETGAWSLAFLDLPSTLLKDEDLLGRVETMVGIAKRVNATIESRETFQIQHLSGGENFYFQTMTRYVEQLRYPHEDLLQRIDEASSELLAIVEPESWWSDLRPQINSPPQDPE
jgi:hypothetical protein